MTRSARASIPLVALLAITAAAAQSTSTRPQGEPTHTTPTPHWYKGNTHTHTIWSDGDGAPEVVAAWYREHGYHFLVLSDHNVLSEGETWFPVAEGPGSRLTAARLEDIRRRFGADWTVERTTPDGKRQMRLKTLAELRARFEAPGEFLFIQGEELTDAFEKIPVHVNGLHLAELIPPQGGTSVRDTIQRNVDAVIEQGRRLGRPTLAHINHPNYGWALTPEDVASVRGERFFEVYNGHSGVRNYGDERHPGTEMMWDVALTLRLAELDLGVLYGLATDDAHHYHASGLGHPNPGRGWVMVRAARLAPAAIINAMQDGDFYASSGVVLRDVRSDGKRLAIEIAPEPDVQYTTRFIGTRRSDRGTRQPVGEVLLETEGTRATYVFRGDELYVRATVTSTRAHPNPYAEGDRECAWVQPVVVAATAAPPP